MIADKTFKVKLNSSSDLFSKVRFQKTNTTLNTIKMDIGGKPAEDLYYDEIIYYDGGGVEGYGND